MPLPPVSQPSSLESSVSLEILESLRNEDHKQISQILKSLVPRPGPDASSEEVSRYRQIIADAYPTVDRMKDLRAKALEALHGRNLSLEKSDVLTNLIKNLNHDIQLLSGGKTENFGIEEERKTLQLIIHEIRNPTLNGRTSEERLSSPA